MRRLGELGPGVPSTGQKKQASRNGAKNATKRKRVLLSGTDNVNCFNVAFVASLREIWFLILVHPAQPASLWFSLRLSVEVAELVEHFQWLTQEQSYIKDPEKLEEIKQEIGDILIYLTRLSDKLDIDPLRAAKDKIAINNKKYPVEMVKGSARKYNEGYERFKR